MDDCFDIAIIGMGCSGGHVIHQLLSKPETKNLKILVLDDFDKKYHIDKQWSYWEKGAGQWDTLCKKIWDKGLFYSENDKEINLDLKGYLYKTIRSVDFIKHIQERMQNEPNWTYLPEYVKEIKELKDHGEIHTPLHVFKAKLILDSRIPKNWEENSNHISLKQHFKGWTIRTKEPVFNDRAFTMMDYRLKDELTTSFMYLLPYSQNEALIEFTYFSPDLVPSHHYDSFLKKYISTYITKNEYDIIEIEKGMIPMSTYPFYQQDSKIIITIGTAGGWVKPSTGYSFKLSERYARIVVNNYLSVIPLTTGLYKSKYRLLDATLLRVLYESNEMGPEVFEILYSKHDMSRLFRFLDENSSLLDDLMIMTKLTSIPFVKHFIKAIINKN